MGTVISENVIRGCEARGIYVLAHRVHVSGNAISGNGSHGIEVRGDFHQIENNLITGNAGFGLWFVSTSTDSVYRGNTARDNSGSGCTDPAGTADSCDDTITSNTSHGNNYMPSQM